MISNLIDLGFLKLSNWELIDGNLHCDFCEYANEKNLLYAYVIDRQIKYIGQTVMELKQRLYGYKKPNPKQSTNSRLNELIKNEILNGKHVEIYVFINDESQKYKGYTVNLAAGLEAILIEEFSPEWNIQSNKKQTKPTREIKISSKDKSFIDTNESNYSGNAVCEIILHKSYYGKSFFNIPKSHSEYLGPEDKFAIEVRLGDNSSKILAVCDRTAAKSRAPRIRIGQEFAKWSTDNSKLMEKMKVHFISNHEIKLSTIKA